LIPFSVRSLFPHGHWLKMFAKPTRSIEDPLTGLTQNS
jgi:hypothetical protein